MIEVQEGVDHNGWYFVRAEGKTARTLDELAALLSVPPAVLTLIVRPAKRRRGDFNTPERMRARGVDFDPV